MKYLIRLSILILFTSLFPKEKSLAQTADTIPYSNPFENLAKVYQELDSTLIPHGLLEDRSVQLVDPNYFRGSLPYDDSLAIDIRGYGQLLMSTIGMAYHIDTALQFVKNGYLDYNLDTSNDTMELAVLFAKTS